MNFVYSIHCKYQLWYWVNFISSLHHIKCPGAILHPGTLVARLDLDDPSSVCQATLYTQPLPVCKTDKTQGSKVHQVQNI